MDNKKYYYLKLREDFYNCDEMKILQAMPDGYLYSDILMKMYLQSLKNRGRLLFRDLIPYTPSVIATLTGHSIGVVEKAISIFQNLQLIEILDDGTIFMVNIEEYIGESSTEADRIRKWRKNCDKKCGINCEKQEIIPAINPEEIAQKENDCNTNSVTNVTTNVITNVTPDVTNVTTNVTDGENDILSSTRENDISVSKYYNYNIYSNDNSRCTVDTFTLRQSENTDSLKILEKEKRVSKKKESENGENDCKEECKKIIEYLNEKLGTHYRAKTEQTQRFINARLREGYTVDDFFKVIDKKVAQWKGTKMEQYLRPQTLFRPGNFENYINQPDKATSTSKIDGILERFKNNG